MKLLGHLDWEWVTAQSHAEGWRAHVIQSFSDRCERVLETSLEVPSAPGGWMHQFICEEHWLPLVYETEQKEVYRCPHGHNVGGPEVHAAWRALRHRELGDDLRDLALGALVFDDTRFADAALTLLRRYAELYATFNAGEAAQAWMLRGRAFHQALTEALWAIPVMHAITLLDAHIGTAEKRSLYGHLLVPMAETFKVAHEELIRQGRVESNYTAWLNAALGCVGFLLESDELVRRAIEGEGGFYHHLSLAVRPDGFEYEGSVYYHNFVVLAYVLLAEAALGNGIDLYRYTAPEGQNIRAMMDATLSLAYPDGSLPFLNDGAYWDGGGYWKGSILDRELCEVYEIGYSRFGEPGYGWLLASAYRRRGCSRGEWAAVLYAKDPIDGKEAPPLRTSVLPDSGIATLRPTRASHVVTLVYGPDGGSHTHHDRLSLSIWPWSTDPGTLPYGGRSRKDWYQHSLAHNVLVVDGTSQAILSSCCVFSEEEDGVSVASDKLYEGVFVKRSIAFHDSAVLDVMSVSSEQEHSLWWVLFLDGTWEIDGVTEVPSEHLGTAPPDLFVEVSARRGKSNEPLSACTVRDSVRYKVEVGASVPFEVLVGKTPPHASHYLGQREVLILCCEGRDVRFEASYGEEKGDE